MADAIASNNIGSNALLASGTRDQAGDGDPIVAAPGAGRRIALRELYLWLVDASDSNTVIPKLGGLALPPVGLASGRTFFGIRRESGEAIRLADNTALYLNLSGTDAVAVMCFYDIE